MPGQASCALIGVDGAVDRWALPMHGAPAFGVLLDPARGGRLTVRPVDDLEVTRTYIDGGAVLETVFRTLTATVRVTDALNPRRGQPVAVDVHRTERPALTRPLGESRVGGRRIGQVARERAELEVRMPDICDLVLDDHEQFRRRFAELDDKRAEDASAEELARVWHVLGGMLERHASAEERLLYPRLLHKGANAEDETEDAVRDHNDIRAAVARANDAEPGSDEWWRAVLDAREENSDHIAEEEREALPDFRAHVDAGVRNELGARWLEFTAEHAAGSGLSLEQKDVDSYIERNG